MNGSWAVSSVSMCDINIFRKLTHIRRQKFYGKMNATNENGVWRRDNVGQRNEIRKYIRVCSCGCDCLVHSTVERRQCSMSNFPFSWKNNNLCRIRPARREWKLQVIMTVCDVRVVRDHSTDSFLTSLICIICPDRLQEAERLRDEFESKVERFSSHKKLMSTCVDNYGRRERKKRRRRNREGRKKRKNWSTRNRLHTLRAFMFSFYMQTIAFRIHFLRFTTAYRCATDCAIRARVKSFHRRQQQQRRRRQYQVRAVGLYACSDQQPVPSRG